MESAIIKYNEAIIESGERVSKKLKVYIESTIPSYLVSRPSRDILTLAHQQVTKEWWSTAHEKYLLFISPVVIDEITRGDQKLAMHRLEIVKGIELLELTSEIEKLANIYMKRIGLPDTVYRDASHMAIAVIHNIDYLVTWNSTHIANEHVRRQLFKINAEYRYNTPMICTPEELISPKIHI